MRFRLVVIAAALILLPVLSHPSFAPECAGAGMAGGGMHQLHQQNRHRAGRTAQ